MLTILIPSRERPNFIRDLLDNLKVLLTNTDNQKYEIVISENSDLNQYLPIVQSFESLNIRLIRPSKVFMTAEENLFWAWSHATKEYVWILGDDDPVVPIAFRNLIEVLENEKPNALFYNSNLLHPDGTKVRQNRISCINNEFETTIEDLAQRVGIWYGLSGFSTWIIKRELVDSSSALKWIQEIESPIYAHVSIFIKSLKGRIIRFINLPLVDYRMNRSDLDLGNQHWHFYAKQKKSYYRKPWLSGFLEQINSLESEGYVESYFLEFMIEQDHSGTRFPFVEIFTKLLLEQLLLSCRYTSEVIPENDMKTILNFLYKTYPNFIGMWRKLEIINFEISKTKRNYITRKKLQIALLEIQTWWNFTQQNFRFLDWLQSSNNQYEVLNTSGDKISELKDLQYADYGKFSKEVRQESSKTLDNRSGVYLNPPQISHVRYLAAAVLPIKVKFFIHKVRSFLRKLKN